MALTNTEYGRAYKYACLMSLKEKLSHKINGILKIEETESYKAAQAAFSKAEKEGLSNNLVRAANAASKVILHLEPQLEYGKGTLSLIIQTDAQSFGGDVRDIVCAREENGWEIGISCKHNHYAVKHSRLSATIDFGSKWFDIPCSSKYFDSIVPIFNELKDMKTRAIEHNTSIPLWNNIPDKAEKYYIPILNAFLSEIKTLSANNSNIPRKLIEYMLGQYDFYKVTTNDAYETTRIEAINISGTLNQSVGMHRSIGDVAKLKLPTRFHHLGIVPGSDNTIEVVCDEGWALNMRIHNASSRVEPSLKFDVQLVSLPPSIHTQVESW